MERRVLKVGELAKAVGKTVRALHLYEEMGLLSPVSRTDGGYRLYTEDAVARLNCITKFQEMGFTLPQIQGFVRDWEDSESGPAGMQRVRAIFEAKLRETRESMARMRLLEGELMSALGYLES